MRTIAEFLAHSNEGRDFDVRAIATTATEHGMASGSDPAPSAHQHASLAGAPLTVDSSHAAAVFRTTFRRITYALLDTGSARPHHLTAHQHDTLDALLAAETREWTPDVVLTFGGSHRDVLRRRHLRNRGSAIVFGLRNLSYASPDAFHAVDAVLTPSAFLSEHYASRIGLRSTHIPSPIDLEDVRAPAHKPRFLTIINPSLEKGLLPFVRIAHDISCAHPDIPIMVVESRTSARLLIPAGLSAGLDLRDHKNILVSAGTARPAPIFASTRALLVPSVWDEPFGRVAVEALVNGVPPIVSDRGGLPEAAPSGGFVLPLPPELTPRSTEVPSSQSVAHWTELAIRLMTDDAFRADASVRARAAGEQFLPSILAPRYTEFFRSIVRTPGDTRGPGLD